MIRLLEYNKDNMDLHSDCASVFYFQGGCQKEKKFLLRKGLAIVIST